MFAAVATIRQRQPGLTLRPTLVLLAAAVLAACAPRPEPRTISDFMEDGFARDGVLARCNEDADALLDEECANARRAATAVALEADRRERQVVLESESAGKLLAVRERDGGQTLGEQAVSPSSVPAFGAPVGAVMPSMQTASFDVYADGTAPLGRRGLQIEAEPPANDFEIESPELVLSDLVPRPFLTDDAE
jgi:hypothetical protein